VLAAGGAVALALLGLGLTRAWRGPAAPAPDGAGAPPAAPAVSAPLPARLEPSSLFAAAKRRALTWHEDAVLVSVDVRRLDERGVTPEGEVELSYARPSGQSFAGGAETRAERLVLRSSGETLLESESRAGRARVAPEPNCVFEDAWLSARRAGAVGDGSASLRYSWSIGHARPVWELMRGGTVQRTLDGQSCTILTR
jgi:hypothetical protein